MVGSTRANPQVALDEKVLEDADFQAMLDHRRELQEVMSAARTRFLAADKEVKDVLDEEWYTSRGHGYGPYRIGAHRLKWNTGSSRQQDKKTVDVAPRPDIRYRPLPEAPSSNGTTPDAAPAAAPEAVAPKKKTDSGRKRRAKVLDVQFSRPLA